MELKNLLNDMDVYGSRMEELLRRIEETRIFYAVLAKGVRYAPEKLLGYIRRPQVQTA